MKRRSVVAGTLLLAIACVASGAAAQARPAKVGIMVVESSPLTASLVAAFRDDLAGLGYADGKEIEILVVDAGGDYRTLPRLAAELIKAEVAAIVSYGTTATQAAAAATTTIPIVMNATTSALAMGFTDSVGRPTRNVTGLATYSSVDMHDKRLGLMREIMPSMKKMSVLLAAASAGEQKAVEQLQLTGTKLGVSVERAAVADAKALPAAFAGIQSSGADAIYVAPSSLLLNHVREIADLALAHRLGGMYPSRDYADAGGLISYGQNLKARFRRSASYVAKILSGVAVSDLPFEQTDILELVVNMKTANELGIAIPQSIMLMADEVIE